MAEPTLYLFDGSNLLHAGRFTARDELVDRLASFVAMKGAGGVVVFDGAGADREVGRLLVTYAAHADDVIERLAADRRELEAVVVVTSDEAVRGTAGQAVQKIGSWAFLEELAAPEHREGHPSRVADRLDAGTRDALERLRRGA